MCFWVAIYIGYHFSLISDGVILVVPLGTAKNTPSEAKDGCQNHMVWDVYMSKIVNIGHVLLGSHIRYHFSLISDGVILAVPLGTAKITPSEAKDGCQNHMVCDVYMSKIVKFYTLNAFCDINYKTGMTLDEKY